MANLRKYTVQELLNIEDGRAGTWTDTSTETTFAIPAADHQANTQHLDVSGYKQIIVYCNKKELFYNFSTSAQDISGTPGGNSSSGEDVNLMTNPDFESGPSGWAEVVGSGVTAGKVTSNGRNGTSPINGSNDMKVTMATNADGSGDLAEGPAGVRGSLAFSVDSGSIYTLRFKYLINLTSETQPNGLNVVITEETGLSGSGTDQEIIDATVAARSSVHAESEGENYLLDLANATDGIADTAEITWKAGEGGTTYVMFFVGMESASIAPIFQVDDIELRVNNSHSLKWSSHDLWLPTSGSFMIDVPNLGATIYFNYLNNWPGVTTHTQVIRI